VRRTPSAVSLCSGRSTGGPAAIHASMPPTSGRDLDDAARREGGRDPRAEHVLRPSDEQEEDQYDRPGRDHPFRKPGRPVERSRGAFE
jgi:hypothetical protein